MADIGAKMETRRRVSRGRRERAASMRKPMRLHCILQVKAGAKKASREVPEVAREAVVMI